MGMETRVRSESVASLSWNQIAAEMEKIGSPCQMRMIDGELAFPDETPPDNWRELRLGTAAGMVTLKREEKELSVVIWGNADPALLRDSRQLAWICASLANGKIEVDGGWIGAEEFQRHHLKST